MSVSQYTQLPFHGALSSPSSYSPPLLPPAAPAPWACPWVSLRPSRGRVLLCCLQLHWEAAGLRWEEPPAWLWCWHIAAGRVGSMHCTWSCERRAQVTEELCVLHQGPAGLVPQVLGTCPSTSRTIPAGKRGWKPLRRLPLGGTTTACPFPCACRNRGSCSHRTLELPGLEAASGVPPSPLPRQSYPEQGTPERVHSGFGVASDPTSNPWAAYLRAQLLYPCHVEVKLLVGQFLATAPHPVAGTTEKSGCSRHRSWGAGPLVLECLCAAELLSEAFRAGLP